MPQSLSRIVVHLIFSTKNRDPFLRDIELRKQFHAYMAGILQELKCEPILINGVEDHVHVLCNLSRTLSLAKMIEELKKSSSKWIKEQGGNLRDFYWQSGYGVFSVSQSNVESVKSYIAAQEEHHQVVSFQDEFRSFCRKHGVAIDERYVWE
jgi:REP element-mobilizing transposase RayT